MSNDADGCVGCCIVALAVLLAAPFFIAAIPVLAGIAFGLLVYLIWSLLFYAVWKWFFG